MKIYTESKKKEYVYLNNYFMMSFTNSNRRRRNDRRNASSSSRSHSMNDTDTSQTNEQNATTSRGIFYFQGAADASTSHMSDFTNPSSFHSTFNSSLSSLSPFQQSQSSQLENTHRPITRSISKRQHQTNDVSSNSSPSSSSSSSSNCLFTASLSSIDHQATQVYEQQNSIRSLLNSFQNELLKLQNVSSYQKVLVNEKPCNLINMLENRRMNGRMINTFSNVTTFS